MSLGERVVVAMSGGVDSSVAAALLVQQGYDVIGMMMRLWMEPGREMENRCCTPDAMALARRVASRLGIPFYTIDARTVFHETVVSYFEEGYERGYTPNPCLICNKHIRWKFLLNHAKAVGAERMATGHYARLQKLDRQPIQLLQAVDRNKDQSYVLHILNQQQLNSALFPLGNYTKEEVRQLARDFDLPVSERRDSQDLCFLGNENYRPFLMRSKPSLINPGPILHMTGQVLGEHQGLAFYTIGQRKGLGITSKQPLYVIDKDLKNNAIVVGEVEFLGNDLLCAKNVNWISGFAPPEPISLSVKIRYKANFAWGLVTPIGNNQAQVKFDSKLRDITPGQSAVFYDDQVCLGGGIIDQTLLQK
jgi:tRNA-uridine 2-sulfurtransferase